MNQIISIAVSALISFNAFAEPLDVKPHKNLRPGDAYVRVTKLANSKIKFEKCISGLEEKTCENLGKKKSYSLEELRSQRAEEKREIAYSAAGDLGLVVVAALGGVAVMGSVATLVESIGVASELQGIASMSVSLAGPQVLAGTAMINIDALNPIEQNRQAKTLNEEIITDKDVVIDNTEMNGFIERLDLVLSKI